MSGEITKAERAELRRMCEAASAAPWEARKDWMVVGRPHSNGAANCIADAGLGVVEADPILIAAARNALPRLLDALDRAEAERDAARAMVAKATEFAVVPPTARMFGTDALLVAIRPQRDDSILWAVCRHGYVLNKSGEWEWELTPSSRDDAFLARCRFPTLDAAWAAADAAAKRGGATT